jgi:hypothetical protein
LKQAIIRENRLSLSKVMIERVLAGKKWSIQAFNEWFSNFSARSTLKETKVFSRHTQTNFNRKTVIFRLVEKNLRHPSNF